MTKGRLPDGAADISSRFVLDWLRCGTHGGRVTAGSSTPEVERAPGGRWAKGQSGNPGGRAKSIVRELVREHMAGAEEMAPGEYRERAALLAEKVFDVILHGTHRDVLAAAAWLTEQCDGKLPQAVSVDGPAGGVIIRMTDAPPPADADAADN